MTTQISIFNFKSTPVRLEIFDNDPYFCLVDVCDVLNIKNSRRVNAEMLNQKGVRKTYTLTNGGNQELTFINEPNLYRVIFRSNKAEAIDFQNWVFEEVLPQIRKTGSYERKTTVDERTGLRDAVNMLVSKRGLMYSEAYQLIHQRFNVPSIENLTAEQLPQAVEYVHKICLEGELIIDSPKNNEIESWLDLTSMWFALYKSLELLAQVEQPLTALGSRFGSQAYTHATEYCHTLQYARDILMSKLNGVELNAWERPHQHRALKTMRETTQPRKLIQMK